MSGRSRSTRAVRGLLDEVAQLKEGTGVLAVSQDGWTHSRVFLMDGDVIACNAEDDNSRLELMLLAGGHVEYRVLDEVRESVRKGGDLGDLLVRGGHIDGDTLMGARTRLFRDAFFWAAAAEDPQLIWDPRDAIFPDNMQFGIDLPALVAEANSWLESNRHTLSLLASGDYFVAHGRKPREINEAAWAAISVPHAGRALVEAIGASSRKEAVEALTAMFARGVMTIAPDSEGRETRTMRTARDETDTENIDRKEVIATNTAEGMDVARRLADSGPSLDEAPGGELAPPSSTLESELDDYERAARGDFIKSYDVLDKVDLSGVAVLGTGQRDSFGDMPAIELGDEDDDEPEDLSDPDLDVMLDALDRDFPAPNTTHAQLEPLRELDTAELMQPQDDDFSIFGDLDLPEVQPDVFVEEIDTYPLDEVEELPQPARYALPAHISGPFPREELADYYGKISVFNHIFRIIFGTFSEHIGPDNARQRFNALLSSNQRQYPELFQRIEVSDDGAVEPAPILENLARCTDRDHGSLLHQGLYELIFSHLYDAKDMLPGDVESEMMERILVHERQLHPG